MVKTNVTRLVLSMGLLIFSALAVSFLVASAGGGGSSGISSSPRPGKGTQLGSEGEQLAQRSGGMTLGGVNPHASAKSQSHDVAGSEIHNHRQHHGSYSKAESRNSTSAGGKSFVVRGRGQDYSEAGKHHVGDKGSTEWEVAKDNSFFDNIDKHRHLSESRQMQSEAHADDSQEARIHAEEKEEKARVQRLYVEAKKRDAAARLAAKKYTERTFAKINNHRAALRDDSNQGFKSIEAKELATEVERAHPNESAGQIAKRAMKLLNVIMAKSHSSLPSLGQTGPSGI